MNSTLFVGGPSDGEMRATPPGMLCMQVAEHTPLKNPYGPRRADEVHESFVAHTYHLRRVRTGADTYLDLFVIEGMDVQEALCKLANGYVCHVQAEKDELPMKWGGNC